MKIITGAVLAFFVFFNYTTCVAKQIPHPTEVCLKYDSEMYYDFFCCYFCSFSIVGFFCFFF